MKKAIVMVAAIVASLAINAACVDWKVAGTTSDVGKSVYLLTSVADSYENVAAIEAAAISSGIIIKQSSRAWDTGTVVASGSNVSIDSMANAYFLIVADDGKSFSYVDANLSAKVYNPDAQESSKGAFTSVKAADILGGSTGTIGSVPEPTSGLLLLLGMAGLALRRKQK